MAQRTLTAKTLNNVLVAVPGLVGLPARRFWSDYDSDADVLYLSFERPQKATDSVMRDDGILLRYRGRKLIGLTVFEASKR
jgi:uncharacterized protein YuzE